MTRNRYHVRVWQAVAPELNTGEMALIVEGPDTDGTIAREQELARFVEVALNAALVAFAHSQGAPA